MKAGREMDAEVAVKVMGWRKLEPNNIGGWWLESDGWYDRELDDTVGHAGEVWSPSTDIAAAWTVMERLRIMMDEQAGLGPNSGAVTLQGCCRPASEWCCIACGDGIHEGQGETAPLAICLAALAAVGVTA